MAFPCERKDEVEGHPLHLGERLPPPRLGWCGADVADRVRQDQAFAVDRSSSS